MIKGELVTIRNVKEADLEELYELSFNFEDPGEFMPMNLVSEVAFKQEFSGNGFWDDFSGKLIIEDPQGNMIGEGGFFKSAHYMDGREIYYRIFSGHRGKGFASDALAVLVRFFFTASSMNRIQAVTVQGNSTSEHILKKAGFVYEGTLRKARYFRGQLVDLNLFSCIREAQPQLDQSA